MLHVQGLRPVIAGARARTRFEDRDGKPCLPKDGGEFETDETRADDNGPP